MMPRPFTYCGAFTNYVCIFCHFWTTYFPSLHFLCIRLYIFLTTYPPLSANVICKYSKKYLNISQYIKFCLATRSSDSVHQLDMQEKWGFLNPDLPAVLISDVICPNCVLMIDLLQDYLFNVIFLINRIPKYLQLVLNVLLMFCLLNDGAKRNRLPTNVNHDYIH